MKHLITVITVFCLLSTQSFAAVCYTPTQYRAEQAIRFHTNMMVLGLYCKSVLRQDTYGTYQKFTSRNQNVIRKEENTLVSYYKQNKKSEGALHSLRTDLANKASLQASRSIISFCQQNMGDYERAKSMKPSDFERWIDQINVKTPKPTTHSLCSATKAGK